MEKPEGSTQSLGIDSVRITPGSAWQRIGYLLRRYELAIPATVFFSVYTDNHDFSTPRYAL